MRDGKETYSFPSWILSLLITSEAKGNGKGNRKPWFGAKICEAAASDQPSLERCRSVAVLPPVPSAMSWITQRLSSQRSLSTWAFLWNKTKIKSMDNPQVQRKFWEKCNKLNWAESLCVHVCIINVCVELKIMIKIISIEPAWSTRKGEVGKLHGGNKKASFEFCQRLSVTVIHRNLG